MRRTFILLSCLSILLAGCHTPAEPTYTVGFSQCSGGIWREVMKQEMADELLLHPDLQLHYRCAWDHADIQCQQIDSFIQEKVDILVVAPLEVDLLQDALQRVYQAGIPVIIFDRPMPGNEWTAFIGGDNRQVGRTQAQWLRQLQQKEGRPIRVVEFTGSLTTAPAVWRHEGLVEGLREDGETISLVASIDGQWEKNITDRLCDSLLSTQTDIDAIVTHSDWMASGVIHAASRHGLKIPVIGVDALPGKDNGIVAVLSGKIDATTTYPSRGDLVIRLASQILHGEPYERVNNLQTILVGCEEAKSMQMIHEAYQSQISALRTLHERVLNLTHQYNMQQVAIILLITLVILLIGMVIGGWRWYVVHHRMQQAHIEQEKVILRQQMHLEQMSQQMESLRMSKAIDATQKEAEFLHHLTNQIEILMTDQNLDVETLSRVMGMSRTALFRRVKADIGVSPIELISRLRLERAQRLLVDGNMTVQEVAYEVGFSSPSYFTRCYHEHFGTTPTDSKNRA